MNFMNFAWSNDANIGDLGVRCRFEHIFDNSGDQATGGAGSFPMIGGTSGIPGTGPNA